HAAPEEDRASRQANAHPHGARRGLCLEGWFMSRLSIRWRLTLWYGAVLAGVLAVFGTSVFLLSKRELQKRTSRALTIQMSVIEDELLHVQSRTRLEERLER